MLPAFTIGVEEEYQIIDPQTRSLVGLSNALIETNETSETSQAIVHELFSCEVEIATDVCHTLEEVCQALVQARQAVTTAAKKNGVAIAAAGTHPFSPWKDQKITSKERYRSLRDDLGQVVSQLIILGCHVHVGIEDREMAVQVVNRARIWLPTLLALTANSPFLEGKDTGYDSYRMTLWSQLPTAGPPPLFQDYADYQNLITQLIDTGITDDPTKVYWDIRLSERFPTVEFRVSDVCTHIDEAVMLAGLLRALAHTCYQDALHKQPFPRVRGEMLRAAMWQAARYGLHGNLTNFVTMKSLPARTLVTALLDYVQPALEHYGDWSFVRQQVSDILTHGNGAERQRKTYEVTSSYKAVADVMTLPCCNQYATSIGAAATL
ncbi:MAG: carboxylate-amine ligase [Cyanobacteria bacterium J06623_4]